MSKLVILLLLLLICFGCKKEQRDSKPPVDSFYFRGKINSQSLEWIAPFNTSGTDGTNQFITRVFAPENSLPLQNCSSTDLRYQYFEGCEIYEFNSTDIAPSKNLLQVGFVLQTNDWLGASSLLRSWFTKGVKTFGLPRVNCSDQGENGVVIFYKDADGKWWYTTKETRSTSQFTQLALEVENRDNATHMKKWKVQFSCKLSDGNGNQITLSDCELYVPVFRP
jgi:hypothetical protein